MVGVIKSYVIATADLWLLIHASNLLPSLPTPLPYIIIIVNASSFNVSLGERGDRDRKTEKETER